MNSSIANQPEKSYKKKSNDITTIDILNNQKNIA